MSFIPSNWKIIFDPAGTPLTLVDWGEEIDEEIAFPWSQGVDTSKPCRAAVASKFGRGRMETGFTVGVWKTHATQILARNYLLDRQALLPAGVTAPLRIYVTGGNTYELSTAVIASGDGRIPTGTGIVRTWIQYKVEGGKFTVV